MFSMVEQDRPKEFTEAEKRERFERLFMTDVSQRFGILYGLGFDHRSIIHFDLSGSPDNAVFNFFWALDHMTVEKEREKRKMGILDRAMKLLLPKGIPELTDTLDSRE